MKFAKYIAGIALMLGLMSGCSSKSNSGVPYNSHLFLASGQVPTHAVSVQVSEPAIPSRCSDPAAAAEQGETNVWIGCSITMLAAKWGAPTHQMSIPGGAQVLVWEQSKQPPILPPPAPQPISLGPPQQCDVSVTVDASGRIVGITAKSIWPFSVSPPYRCGFDVGSGPTLTR